MRNGSLWTPGRVGTVFHHDLVVSGLSDLPLIKLLPGELDFRVLRVVITDEQVKLSVIVPIDNRDLRARAVGAFDLLLLVTVGRRLHENLSRVENRFLPASAIPVEDNAAVAGSREKIQLAIPVPVHDEGRGVPLLRANVCATRLELHRITVNRIAALALIGDDVDLTFDVADEEITITIVVPVRREDDRGRTDFDRLAVPVLENHGLLEGFILLSMENIELSGPGAGDHVTMSVTIEVHDLWTETDASASWDAADVPTCLEPRKRIKAGRFIRSNIPENTDFARTKLSDEQVLPAIPIHIDDEGRSVANVNIDCLLPNFNLDRLLEIFIRIGKSGARAEHCS